jgi:hypothetical protein
LVVLDTIVYARDCLDGTIGVAFTCAETKTPEAWIASRKTNK